LIDLPVGSALLAQFSQIIGELSQPGEGISREKVA